MCLAGLASKAEPEKTTEKKKIEKLKFKDLKRPNIMTGIQAMRWFNMKQILGFTW